MTLLALCGRVEVPSAIATAALKGSPTARAPLSARQPAAAADRNADRPAEAGEAGLGRTQDQGAAGAALSGCAPGARHALPGRSLRAVTASLCRPAGPAVSIPRQGVTTCGRICFNRQKINLSQVFAGQTVGIKQVDEHLWLATFMHYDLGFFDDETCRLEPTNNPFGPKVLPMSPE